MDNISAWNARIDKTLTVMRWGRQGILYEYILPYGADPMKYYEEAIDVKSRKMGKPRPSAKNGKNYRQGVYQPVGDKRYFNFYQVKKMQKDNDWNELMEKRKKQQLENTVREMEAAIVKEVTNG